MKIQLVPVPAFNDNYIWVLHNGSHAAVVDPGDAAPVQAFLATHNLALDAILLTHHHGDHVGGVKVLHELTGATVYGPATEKLPLCHHRLAEGNSVQLANLPVQLHVLDVPGHTAGHIAFHGTLQGIGPVLFCGDTLFAGGCGRLFEGTPAQMHESLGKLAGLAPETLVCCAHEYTLANLRWARQVEPGNARLEAWFHEATRLRAEGKPTLPSTIALELETNPFCRTSQQSILNAAARHAGQSVGSPVQAFAVLREWKNNF